jgi:hypothetical protein
MPENKNGEQNSNKEPGTRSNTDKQGEVNTSLPPERQEGNSWYQRPHDELVKAFRDHIRQEEKRYGGHWSAEEIIRARLDIESKSRQFNDDKLDEVKRDFFRQLRYSFDALAHDRYKPGSLEDKFAGNDLQRLYGRTHEPTIKLSNPIQVGIIDALTEVLGIPHQRGQSEIEIPENLRNYNKWIFSDEYKERIAKAKRNK